MTLGFIFMLTRDDRTVLDAADHIGPAVAAGVRYIGVKDEGIGYEQLRALIQGIKASGARTCLEVVSLTRQGEARSADLAADLGVDWLLGGRWPEVVLPAIAGSGVLYAPYAGHVVDHPSRLEGTADEIIADAARLSRMAGVEGINLLAYRHPAGADLLRPVVSASAKPVIVAGSLKTLSQMQAVVESGAAGFTVGTGVFDGVFPATQPGVPGQLEAIQAAWSRYKDAE